MPMEPSGPVLSIADTRRAALDRIRHDELDRQEEVLRVFELEKLQAIFQIRAYIEQYGLSRVETWTRRQAEELGLL